MQLLPFFVIVLAFPANKTRGEKRIDIKLAMYVANHSSISSIDHLGEILNIKAEANGDGFNLQLHRSKCSKIITKILNPALIDELRDEIGDQPFSIIVDESTDIGKEKYMAYCICYYNKKLQKLCTDFLGLQMVESCTAENLVAYFRSFMDECKLDLNNLIALATDGASNLCGVNNSLFALLKQQYPHLQLIRCVCHSLSLCASKSAEELPSSLEFLLRETRNWFSHSTLRQKFYEKLYSSLNNGELPLKLTQLSATRWLAYYNAIKTNLDQWDELKSLFLKISQEADKSNNCFLARTLAQMYNDDSNVLYLLFVKLILKEVNDMNLLFQSDSSKVDIYKLYDQLRLIIYSFARRIFKPAFLNWDYEAPVSQQLRTIAYAVEKANDMIGNSVLALDSIDYGDDFDSFARRCKCTPEQILVVKERCKNFLLKLIKELCDRTPANFDFVRKLRFFSPEVCLKPVSVISANSLPWEIFPSNVKFDKDAICNQWSRLQCMAFDEIFPNASEECNPSTIHIGEFWVAVSKITTAVGAKAFEDLADFALRCLSVPLSNAVVERVFSVMNSVKTKPRNRLQILMLNSIMRCRMFLKTRGKCCIEFEPTQKMYGLHNTKNLYQEKKTENTDATIESEEEEEEKRVLEEMLAIEGVQT